MSAEEKMKSKIDLHVFRNLEYDNSGISSAWGKDMMAQLAIQFQKIEIPFLLPYEKIKRWIKKSNHKVTVNAT